MIDIEATCIVVKALTDAHQWDKVELVVRVLQVGSERSGTGPTSDHRGLKHH